MEGSGIAVSSMAEQMGTSAGKYMSEIIGTSIEITGEQCVEEKVISPK